MGELKLKVYNPGTGAISSVTSTVIYGEKEAVLVDAQFQHRFASELVNIIKGLGVELKYIFISHPEPDYYFGTDTILGAFPKAKVIATGQTCYLIEATKDEKFRVYEDTLKSDRPIKLVMPEPLHSDKIQIEGKDILIESQLVSDPGHSYLYIPSLKTILGGASVSQGSHLWLSDVQSKDEIEKWIWQLDSMSSLKPELVIPSHFINSDFSPKIIDEIRRYLLNYLGATRRYTTSEAIVNAIKQAYPNLQKEDELRLGAEVYTHEREWPIKAPYPPIGRKLTASFDGIKAVFDYLDNKTVSYKGLLGAHKGESAKVSYKATEIGKSLFMVTWKEKESGRSVVQVQDFANEIIYTNITEKNGDFLSLKGKLEIE